MRRLKIILVAALAIQLAGCLLSGKPKVAPAAPAPPQPVAPAPPPEPLSVPQTHVDLPEPQAVDQKALATAPPVEPPPPVQQRPTPLPKQPRTTVPQTRPVEPTPEPPPETSRPPIQEILPADVQKQLQTSAQKHKADARALLAQARGRRLNANERTMVASITQFLTQSEQAEKTGDMRAADEFAEKAYLLAKELQSGK
jgi:hypothetical protein